MKAPSPAALLAMAALSLPLSAQDAFDDFTSDQALLAPAAFLLDASASLGLPIQDVYFLMLQRNAFPLAACESSWLPFGDDGLFDRLFFFPDGSWVRLQPTDSRWRFGYWTAPEIPGGDDELSIRLVGTDFSANFVFRLESPYEPMHSTFECGLGLVVKGTASVVPIRPPE